ncbi:helix-turn-helix transcriptional regulator [Paenibacillus sp. S-38]|uniref:helix-turn-helix transcriptional regulator n=1 Tax=Paenibacillus sp. S-38 TaxID=3416710 RepID=UPI003CF0CFD1
MKIRIRDMRAERSWTQEQLSERVGVSRQTIISIENGRYNPLLELAFKLAKVFRCRIEELFISEEEGREAEGP